MQTIAARWLKVGDPQCRFWSQAPTLQTSDLIQQNESLKIPKYSFAITHKEEKALNWLCPPVCSFCADLQRLISNTDSLCFILGLVDDQSMWSMMYTVKEEDVILFTTDRLQRSVPLPHGAPRLSSICATVRVNSNTIWTYCSKWGPLPRHGALRTAHARIRRGGPECSNRFSPVVCYKCSDVTHVKHCLKLVSILPH